MILVNAKIIQTSNNPLSNGGYIIKRSDEVKANHLKIRLLEHKKKRLLSVYHDLDAKSLFNLEAKRVAKNVFSAYAKAKAEVIRLEAINYRLFKEKNKDLTKMLYNHFQA